MRNLIFLSNGRNNARGGSQRGRRIKRYGVSHAGIREADIGEPGGGVAWNCRAGDVTREKTIASIRIRDEDRRADSFELSQPFVIDEEKRFVFLYRPTEAATELIPPKRRIA